MTRDTSGLHLRPRLLANGYTSDEVQRARRAGRLVAVRRGAYLRPDDERLADAEAAHALLVAATVPRLAGDAVVSHQSAAVLHGLPVWKIDLRQVHVTRAGCPRGRIGARVHRHTAPLGPDEVVELDGIPVTSAARTVVDLARSVGFEQGVVTTDAALRFRLVDGRTLDAALRQAAGMSGCPAARRIAAFSDGGAESVGESRSRVALDRFGLPAPILQWKVESAGRVIAVSDFGWPELRTVGEFDGRIKYEASRPGRTAGEVVFAEKVREDAVRDENVGVVRWIWDDLDAFAPVAARLRRTFRPR